MSLRVLVAILLLVSVVVGPALDLVIFGIHEHDSAAASDVLGLHVQHSHSAPHHGGHHCDFWMNPGDLSAPIALHPPIGGPVRLTRHAPCHVIVHPFRPFTPPRG